jgi:L-alanine-DL-glutamate epimerase-like enolase superfamily enzyme
MKIADVSTLAVSLPLGPKPYATERAGTKREWDRQLRWAPHRPGPTLDYVIVKLTTDDGITGLGEAATDIGFFGEPVEEVQNAIDRYLGPKLIGRDPFDREEILHALDYRGNTCARSGIDLALHDLLGKALGIPVYDLIGGCCRDKVLVAIEIAGGPPDAMAQLCAQYVELGVRAFKPKIGGNPEADAVRLKAIREAVGPGISIRADATQGYSPKEAIRLCRLAERYAVGLELLEQPVPAWDLEGMALVRRAVDTLIEADESAYDVHDVVNIIRHGSADVINVKVAKAGGLYNAKAIAALADAAGLGCVLGTAYGLGIKVAAKLHLAASTRNIMDAVEFTELMLHENLASRPHDRSLMPPLEDGYLRVPSGPGFGVQFDWDRLHRYVINPGPE